MQLVSRARRGGAPRQTHDLDLAELLAPDRWEPTRQRSAERAKALAYVQQMVTQARRLLALPGHADRDRLDAVREELRQLLKRDPRELRIDSAWELYTALKQALLLIADERYVLMLLEHEATRSEEKGKWHGWTQHFAAEDLGGFRDAVARGEPDAIRAAVSRLTFLYAKRAEAGRERRAKAVAKCRSLKWLAPLLCVLLAVFAASIVVNDPSTWKHVLLAASAGALGSILAGILRLRDQLAELDDLRAFGATIPLQPLIGATAGLIVLLVLESGVLRTGDSEADVSIRGLVAFVAGFSEPFFLGLVQRIAVVSDRPAT